MSNRSGESSQGRRSRGGIQRLCHNSNKTRGRFHRRRPLPCKRLQGISEGTVGSLLLRRSIATGQLSSVIRLRLARVLKTKTSVATGQRASGGNERVRKNHHRGITQPNPVRRDCRSHSGHNRSRNRRVFSRRCPPNCRIKQQQRLIRFSVNTDGSPRRIRSCQVRNGLYSGTASFRSILSWFGSSTYISWVNRCNR